MGAKFTRIDNDKGPIGGPDISNWPNYDPLYGFEEGREERVMKVTEEEMMSAKMPLQDRNYCAHLLIKYSTCRRDVFPLVYRCGHEKHEYLNCQYEDYLIRMKEYEREKRLQERAKRKAARAAREELGA